MPGDKKTEGPHILVVDDDEGVREAMVGILEMMDYCVASATNASGSKCDCRDAAKCENI